MLLMNYIADINAINMVRYGLAFIFELKPKFNVRMLCTLV